MMIQQQQSRHALGSEALLTLVDDDETQLPELFALLWHEIQLFEQTFSRFRADSELSFVNQRAGLPVEITPEFRYLVSRARALSLETKGIYNPFVLPALQRAGYKGSWPTPADSGQAQDYSHRKVVSAEEIVISPDSLQLPAETALDFGGIGKGYLLDMLADQLQANGCHDFWLSLGGDIVVQGHDGTDGAEAWNVGVARAAGSGEAAHLQNMGGKRMAVATSGIIKRRGANWHHLIDPRTNLPAETDILTATVCLPSATEADVYAKCLVIVGSGGAPDFLQKHKITQVVLQTSDEHDTLRISKKGI